MCLESQDKRYAHKGTYQWNNEIQKVKKQRFALANGKKKDFENIKC